MVGRNGIKIQNIQSWIMVHTFSTIIGTRTISLVIGCSFIYLCMGDMDVTSSSLCGCSFTTFYQRIRVGVSSLVLIWFGPQFRLVRRDIISWIIQKMTRLYQVFKGPLVGVVVASRNTVWGAISSLILLNVFQSQHNL